MIFVYIISNKHAVTLSAYNSDLSSLTHFAFDHTYLAVFLRTPTSVSSFTRKMNNGHHHIIHHYVMVILGKVILSFFLYLSHEESLL